jgi:ribosomal protein L14E/L6E/L27E
VLGMDITVGMLVYSKAGRDNKNLFLVLEVENGYAYIADGDMRKSEKPKKKKLIHLQKTNYIFDNVSKDIENFEIRRIIAQHKPI